MDREELRVREAALADVPPGTVRMETGETEAPAPAGRTDGRGRVELYRVCPGITAAFSVYRAGWAAFRHGADPAVLEVHYCRAGRIGWSMRGGEVYLGPGDLTVHARSCCADSTMAFPLGWAEEISLSVDLEELERTCPEPLREAGVSPARLRERLCGEAARAVPACPETAWIFAPLAAAPPERRLPYLRLKSQELLLYLDGGLPGGEELPRYVSGQTERVRELHRLLTEHLDRRYTIEELSRRYLINSSSLKELFKAVYGQPIAAYMKEYRVRRAMELLRDTDESVAGIAARVGYGTQGKFTQAFKDVTGMVPTAYRRLCRER